VVVPDDITHRNAELSEFVSLVRQLGHDDMAVGGLSTDAASLSFKATELERTIAFGRRLAQAFLIDVPLTATVIRKLNAAANMRVHVHRSWYPSFIQDYHTLHHHYFSFRQANALTRSVRKQQGYSSVFPSILMSAHTNYGNILKHFAGLDFRLCFGGRTSAEQRLATGNYREGHANHIVLRWPPISTQLPNASNWQGASQRIQSFGVCAGCIIAVPKRTSMVS
jgi:hypothetical protein